MSFLLELLFGQNRFTRIESLTHDPLVHRLVHLKKHLDKCTLIRRSSDSGFDRLMNDWISMAGYCGRFITDCRQETIFSIWIPRSILYMVIRKKPGNDIIRSEASRVIIRC